MNLGILAWNKMAPPFSSTDGRHLMRPQYCGLMVVHEMSLINCNMIASVLELRPEKGFCLKGADKFT
jgi:hypothetical protein